MTTAALPACEVFGAQCAVGDIGSAAHAVAERALSGAGGYIVFCNVHVLMTARRQPDLMQAIKDAWMVFPDGAPLAWFERRAGNKEAQRIGGPDLLPAVFDRGRSLGLRHALFGSTPMVVEALADRLRDRFPGVEIVATHAPALGEEDNESLLSQLGAARPDIVWCALGAPKQELWMAQRSTCLAPALVLGVGAAFDFHAGAKSRAPRWMQSLGLEWLHRFMSEPRRLGRRYLVTNSQFVLLSLRTLGSSLVRRN